MWSSYKQHLLPHSKQHEHVEVKHISKLLMEMSSDKS